MDLHEVMSEIPSKYEILVVMGDKEKLHPHIPKMLNQQLLKSYGDSLERAILTGFSHAEGHIIIVMDADGSHPIFAIPDMIKGLIKHDMVVGSRYLDESEYDYSPLRKFVAWCFRKYAHIHGSQLSDPMSGYFAIKRDLLDKVRFKPLTWKTGLEIELKASPSILEIPIKFKKRQAGFSKANAKTGIKIIFDLLLG